MEYDIFFSYAHAARDAALPVITALKARKLRVFHDETEITDGDSIVRRIVEGLGRARMLVAWYSATYPTRRACQWELTSALIAARHEFPDGRTVERRILAEELAGQVATRACQRAGGRFGFVTIDYICEP